MSRNNAWLSQDKGMELYQLFDSKNLGGKRGGSLDRKSESVLVNIAG